MPFLFQYLIKFSISLAALYTFYFLVLRPLTFYQWNRFYLVCYSLLSFVIPFINVTGWLNVKDIDNSYLVNSIPAVDKFTSHSLNTSTHGSNILATLLSLNFVALLFAVGASAMLIRIVYQYLSLRAMKRKAVLLKTGDFEFYDVNGPIAPFSFANAIFINSRLHSEEEFHKILEHEFVHVKQKHTIDIIVAELVCVFNWFNPFAWLIRTAIRQNLEFIADNNVLRGGIDPRKYQYLLLKVMGLPQYSITNNFSFSSLKKRIAMMNKMKTARIHLIRFLFVLPLFSVMLLAFRDKINAHTDGASIKQINHLHKEAAFKKYQQNAEIIDITTYSKVGSDTVPKAPLPPAPPAVVAIDSVAVAPVPSVPAAFPKKGKAPVAPVAPTINAVPVEAPVAPPLPVSPKVAVVKVDNITEVKVTGKKAAINTGAAVENVTSIKQVIVKDTGFSHVVIRDRINITEEPLYIVDGKRLPKGNLNDISPNSIESISVLKGASAFELYGAEAVNGVIEILTKDFKKAQVIAARAKLIDIKNLSAFDGLIIVDGKELSKEKLSDLNPESIESVTVLKDAAAVAVYNEKGRKGVILITTKKAL